MFGFQQNPHQRIQAQLNQIQAQLSQIQAACQQAIQCGRYDIVQRMHPTYVALQQKYAVLQQQIAFPPIYQSYAQYQPVNNSACMSVQDQTFMSNMNQIQSNAAQSNHYNALAQKTANRAQRQIIAMEAKRLLDDNTHIIEQQAYLDQVHNRNMSRIWQQ